MVKPADFDSWSLSIGNGGRVDVSRPVTGNAKFYEATFALKLKSNRAVATSSKSMELGLQACLKPSWRNFARPVLKVPVTLGAGMTLNACCIEPRSSDREV